MSRIREAFAHGKAFIPFVTAGYHAGHIVVYSASQNGSQYDPQKNNRPETCPHKGTEDRACSRNIKKLY